MADKNVKLRLGNDILYPKTKVENITNIDTYHDATKQDTITSSNKVSADLVNDSTSTNKFVTTDNKTTWNNKQDALVSGTNIKTINGQSILTSGNINASEVSVSSTGTSTTEAKYITVNNTEYKIGGGITYEIVREPWDTTPMTSAEATAAGFTWGTEV